MNYDECIFQVLSDLRLGPRVEKESIMVRWAGKKRDRVDEILVRELQVIHTLIRTVVVVLTK